MVLELSWRSKCSLLRSLYRNESWTPPAHGPWQSGRTPRSCLSSASGSTGRSPAGSRTQKRPRRPGARCCTAWSVCVLCSRSICRAWRWRLVEAAMPGGVDGDGTPDHWIAHSVVEPAVSRSPQASPALRGTATVGATALGSGSGPLRVHARRTAAARPAPDSGRPVLCEHGLGLETGAACRHDRWRRFIRHRRRGGPGLQSAVPLRRLRSAASSRASSISRSTALRSTAPGLGSYRPVSGVSGLKRPAA